MQHSQKYQHFALDANNNIIDIHSADKVCGKRYFCPHCHNEMIAKRGNVRQWHFAHKTEKCGPRTSTFCNPLRHKVIQNNLVRGPLKKAGTTNNRFL